MRDKLLKHAPYIFAALYLLVFLQFCYFAVKLTEAFDKVTWELMVNNTKE